MVQFMSDRVEYEYMSKDIELSRLQEEVDYFSSNGGWSLAGHYENGLMRVGGPMGAREVRQARLTLKRRK